MAVRLLTEARSPGESAGAHVLRYLVQLNLSALAALTKYSDRGWLTRQHCFPSPEGLCLWLIGCLLLCSYGSLRTCQCPDLYL